MTELTENPGYFSPETTEEALRNANPLNDALFKFLFANERNRENMLRLLNDIMPERRGLDFEYKDREHDADREGGHRSYFDVRLKANDGRICHVEVQLWHEAAMFERVVYYAVHSFTDQLLEGEGYGALNPVVFIVILKNTLFRDSPEHWRTTFQLTAREVKRNDFWRAFKGHQKAAVQSKRVSVFGWRSYEHGQPMGKRGSCAGREHAHAHRQGFGHVDGLSVRGNGHCA